VWALAGVLVVALLPSGCRHHAGARPKVATSTVALAEGFETAVPHWAKKEQLPPNAIPGAKLFAMGGCLNCHRYLRSGASQLGGPNLSAEGSKHRGLRFQIAHLKCPSCMTKGSPMPSFAAWGPSNLRKVAIFLEASKGAR
jgi:Cytochrome c